MSRFRISDPLDIACPQTPSSVREWCWSPEQPLPEMKTHPEAVPGNCPVGDKTPTVRQNDIPPGEQDYLLR